MSGILYVTGTPIGNLGDFSPRAAETLESVDFIAAEDTRVTLKLLNHFGIKKPMVSYFEHNKRERGEIICNRIEQGENCAIVTDAGMPCISDPGEDLIKLCEERGIKTVVIPGPSAVISALAVSGLETGRFTFEGFLSVNKKSRSEHLDSLKNEHRTMIFYEAPVVIDIGFHSAYIKAPLCLGRYWNKQCHQQSDFIYHACFHRLSSLCCLFRAFSIHRSWHSSTSVNLFPCSSSIGGNTSFNTSMILRL